jgi:hypothetical protein
MIPAPSVYALFLLGVHDFLKGFSFQTSGYAATEDVDVNVKTQTSEDSILLDN